MAYCRKCGTPLDDRAKFCPKCGTSRSSSTQINANNREITIGRSTSCDISLGDSLDFASTYHGTIFWKGTQLMYKDTSTNGTVINNIMVHLKTVPINHGDTILIAGKYQISWEKIDSLLAPSSMSYQPTRLLKLNAVTSCRKCGTPLDDRAKFCPNCGTFQSGSTPINTNKREIIIGRSSSCDISLGESAEYASTYHGTIFWNGNQLMYKDTSTNGTVINNTMVHGKTVPINHGDTILIAGKYQISWGKIDSLLAPSKMPYQPTSFIKMTCSKCGTRLNEGAKFCPKCGNEMSGSHNNPSFKINEQSENRQTTYRAPVDNSEANSYYTSRAPKRNSPNNIGAFPKFIILTAVGLLIMWYLGAFEGEILTISGGRAAFVVENQDCSNTSLANINKIILYEGNSRQDCKVEGESKNGELLTLVGKWKKEDVGEFSFRKYYILRFNKFNLLINSDKKVCYHKGSDSGISDALKHSSIGKLRPISKNEENHVSEKFNKKVELYKKETETQAKIKKIADIAYQKGWNRRMKSKDFPDPRGVAHMEYTMRYGVEPTEPGEEKRWNVFVENYVKGYVAAWEEIRKRIHSEDL